MEAIVTSMFESIPATFSQAMAVECVTESAEAYRSADISVGTTQVNVRQLEEAGGAASGIVIAFRGTDCLRIGSRTGGVARVSADRADRRRKRRRCIMGFIKRIWMCGSRWQIGFRV
jgi:hypothetical protein